MCLKAKEGALWGGWESKTRLKKKHRSNPSASNALKKINKRNKKTQVQVQWGPWDEQEGMSWGVPVCLRRQPVCGGSPGWGGARGTRACPQVWYSLSRQLTSHPPTRLQCLIRNVTPLHARLKQHGLFLLRCRPGCRKGRQVPLGGDPELTKRVACVWDKEKNQWRGKPWGRLVV